MLTLQFSTEDGLASEMVRVFSRGWASHVDVALPDGLLGARFQGGVRIRAPNYCAFRRIQSVVLSATLAQEETFVQFLRAQVGKPYDATAIAAFAAARDWREPDSWFCSELVAAALETCGWFPHPLAFASNEITPRDLLLVVSPWAQ